MRGSTPCHGDEIARYGGNTSSVSVDVPDHDPILLDLGTGVRYFGVDWPTGRPFTGSCLLTHLHWDHVQGLPFFSPLLHPEARLDVYAPTQPDGQTINDLLRVCLCPPLFPIGIDDFPASLAFHNVANDEFTIGEVEVTSRLVPHLGNTCGYRLDWGGASLAYISDHQQTGTDRFEATDGARDLCRDVDVLIHDSQYTPDEFVAKPNWGHCTVDYAVWLAQECGVRTLVLYHHDPLHDDDQVDGFVAAASERGARTGMRVIGAREGATIHVGD